MALHPTPDSFAALARPGACERQDVSRTQEALVSDARHFQQHVGAQLATELGGTFKFYRSRLELRRSGAAGADVIVIAGSTKWSPLISLSFYFGRAFDQSQKDRTGARHRRSSVPRAAVLPERKTHDWDWLRRPAHLGG